MMDCKLESIRNWKKSFITSIKLPDYVILQKNNSYQMQGTVQDRMEDNITIK